MLQARLRSKHEKKGDEGAALRALREIRVRAAPSWDGERVDVMFWFIRDDSREDFEGEPWDQLLDKWLDLLPSGGRFDAEGVVASSRGERARHQPLRASGASLYARAVARARRAFGAV